MLHQQRTHLLAELRNIGFGCNTQPRNQLPHPFIDGPDFHTVSRTKPRNTSQCEAATEYGDACILATVFLEATNAHRVLWNRMERPYAMHHATR
jgi:hypothetical protein